MITLGNSGTLQGKAGTGSAVTYTVSGDSVTGGVDSFQVLGQGQLGTSAAAMVTIGGSAVGLIKDIHLSNTTGTAVSNVILYVNGTAAGNQLINLTIPANGQATYGDDGWKVLDASGNVQTTQNLSFANVDSVPNAQAATITGGVITLEPSSASFPGVMTAAQYTKLAGLVSGPSGWIDVTQQSANPVLVSNSGATNNTNLAAIMSAAPSGSVLYFPPGWYTFASTITVPAKVFIFQGSGAGLNGALSAFTWTTNNAGDWITQTGSDYYMQFRDIGFIAQLSQSAGACVNVNGNANNHFYNCEFTGLSATQTLLNCINFNGTNGGEESIVYGCDFTNFTGTGIICNSNLETVIIDSCTMNGGAIAAAGINVILGGAVQIDNCDIIGCTNNLLVNPAVSTVVASVFATNSYFDNSGGSCIKLTGAGAVVRTKFQQCSFTTAAAATGATAFECSTTTYAYGAVGQGLDIINCNVLNTFGTTGATNGFNMTGCGDFHISDCNIAGWATGINVTPTSAAGTTRPMITGNVIGNAGGYGVNTVGIQLNSGSFSYGAINIQNNTMNGNTTPYAQNAAITLATANTVLVEGNIGFLSPVYISAFTSATGTGAQTVTGATMALPIGTYLVQASLPYVGAGTVGSTHTHAFTFSAGTPTGNISGLSVEAAVASGTGAAITTTPSPSVTSATHTAALGTFDIQMYVVLTTACTIQLTVTNTTSADTVTLQAGGVLTAQKIL